jgi:dephospho-CoA kinase
VTTSSRRNIALYGRSGSGKSTVGSMLVETGYQHLRTGAECRELCRTLFQSEAKTVMNRVTDALREIDPTVWLRAALVGASDAPVVFDSMRFPQDYAYLKERRYLLVRIDTPTALRLERLKSRGQEYNPARDDFHDTEILLDAYEFDCALLNSGSLADLLCQVSGLGDHV